MKIIKIKNCNTCMFGIPWKENSVTKEELICLKIPIYSGDGTFHMTYKKIEDRNSIPEWCPLEDYEVNQ